MIAAILAFLFGFPLLALVLAIYVVRSRRAAAKLKEQENPPRPVTPPEGE